MITSFPDGVWRSTLFATDQSILHGFSTMNHGDMSKDIIARSGFVDFIGLSAMPLVTSEQVHGSVVRYIQTPSTGVVEGADGIVIKNSDGACALGVFGADCSMILFSDSNSGIIGGAHAGWKGTVERIVDQVLDTMIALGASLSTIKVAIGPTIRSCCYSIDEDRLRTCLSVLPNDAGIFDYRDSKSYLDIVSANQWLMRSKGVLPEHIDICRTCTCCGNIFHSYRRDKAVPTRENIGIIGFSL